MKQQQALGGFLGAQANFYCQFCDAGLINCADLTWNTITHSWYHYQVISIQEKSFLIHGKVKKKMFLVQQGLRPNFLALKSLTLGLDLLIGCSPDFVHSEFFSLVWRLYPLLNFKILIKRVAAKFAMFFHSFVFLPGWRQIQSSATHMLSWSMSKCGHASIIIPILLHCWLKEHHLCQFYKDELQVVFTKEQPFLQLFDVDWVVFCFGRLAKSNLIISSFHLSAKDCRVFGDHMICACHCFLKLMHAAGNLKTTTEKGEKKEVRTRKSRNLYYKLILHLPPDLAQD